MDVQIEHVEGHNARLTVTVDSAVTQGALQKAAKRVSQKYRIPGFRPGKAPYNVILNMFGKAQLADEAIGDLTQELYPQALEQSQVNPVAPGQLLDYRLDDEQLVMIFNVPKATEVNLGDYRTLRHELEIQPVTDEALAEALENLRQSRAVVEEVDRVAKEGDEVHGALKVVWWHDDDDHEGHQHDHDHAEGEAHDHEHDDTEADSESDDPHAHQHEHVIFDEQEAKVVLWEAGSKRNAIFPGLSEGLVGIKAGENRLLHLTMPDDFEDEELRGKALEVTFNTVSVHSRHVPELNDTFAAAASQNEVETLLDLRMKMRQDMEKSAERIGKNKLLDQMLADIIEQAEVVYHPAALDDYLESMMNDMNAMLKERMGMSLDNFLRLTGQDRAALAEQYADEATQRLRRDMVTLKILEAERLSVANDEVNAEIDRMASTYGEQADSWRTLLDTDDMRRDIIMRLLNDKLLERVVAIATGQAPALEDLPDLATSESDSPQ